MTLQVSAHSKQTMKTWLTTLWNRFNPSPTKIYHLYDLPHPYLKVHSAHRPTNGEVLFQQDCMCFLDVLNVEQEEKLAQECDQIINRRPRRYESSHWDSVILNFKEVEYPYGKYSEPTREILLSAQTQIEENLGQSIAFLPFTHIIDLAPSGVINAHIDSVKFSGPTIVGINLSVPIQMTLIHEKGRDFGHYQLNLPPRSMYVLRDTFRYSYTHAIDIDCDPKRRRLSIILRDHLPSEVK